MNTPDYWLNVLLECNRRDHSPEFSSGDQGGPTRTSRAFAIALRAMADAYFGAGGTWPLSTAPTQFLNHNLATPTAGVPCSALHGAAVTSLLYLYPQSSAFITEQANRVGINHGASTNFGRQVAEAHILDRMCDGSERKVAYVYAETAGAHRPDPDNDQPEALGANWGAVTSFVGIRNIVLADPPGYLGQGQIDRNHTDYKKAVLEVMAEGHSGIAESNPNNALIGIYWGYDGANLLGTPPRLYLQIIQKVCDTNKLNDAQKMLVYASSGTAMGEAGIQAWFNKYHFNLWRPVVGVREHDTSMGYESTPNAPAKISGNPLWLPLGAPRTNGKGKNFTPDFPAYPSGHATFGAASLEVTQLLLEKFLKKKTGTKFPFCFVSDEFDGVNKDVRGTTRPRHERKFDSLKDAYIENGVSRVYLGVHWRFDSHLEDKSGNPIVTAPGDPDFVGGLPLGVEIAKCIVKSL
jgi:hypothetical protein